MLWLSRGQTLLYVKMLQRDNIYENKADFIWVKHRKNLHFMDFFSYFFISF